MPASVSVLSKRRLIAIVPALVFTLTAVFASAKTSANHASKPDSSLNPEVKHIIEVVIHASSKFDIEKVANLYSPNAVVVDEEPPYSWNGPTAGVQWVYAVEKAVKDFKLSNFKASLGDIKIYQQTSEIVYLIAPVTYTGSTGADPFEERGAFTFVLRRVSDQWLIKSQAWMPERALQ